jgi:heme o synthase
MKPLRLWSLLAILSTFLLMVVGAYVVKTGAGLSCPDWPTCNGQWFPPFPSPQNAAGDDVFTQQQILSEWFHRLFAAVAGLFTVGLMVHVYRHHRRDSDLMTLAVSAVGLLFVQIFAGALTVNLGNAPWTVVLHQGLAITFFGILVAIFVRSFGRAKTSTTETEPATPRVDEAKEPRTLVGVLSDYAALVKPRVLLLLLVSAVTSMLIAVGRDVDVGLVLATVAGGAMASGAGSAFNQWWERDLDAMMARTAGRPVAAGRMSEAHVLAFAASLAAGSFMVLWVFANLLAASLALAGALFYVVIYTIWLKRSRPSNIVIGGAAGSFPVLVGWAAATGEITWPALVLGFIVFLWTPPHFWAFALLHKQDYARANVPMLPVVKGDGETKQQIVLYSLALFLCATGLWLFGVVGQGYLVAALVLSSLFVWLAFQTLRDTTPRSAQRLFRFSILYLGLLFLAMAVDRLLELPILLQ